MAKGHYDASGKAGSTHVEELEKIDKRSIKAAICTACLLFVAVGMVVLSVFVFAPLAGYNSAVSMYNDGEYYKAKVKFQTLGEFSESEKMILACDYGIAKDLFQSKEYPRAASVFEKLARQDFMNSSEMALASEYNTAIALYNDGKYDKAAEKFLETGDYADSVNMAVESRYQSALTSIGRGLYTKAAEQLEALGDYKQAKSLLEKYGDSRQR